MHLCMLFEECLTCCTNERYHFYFIENIAIFLHVLQDFQDLYEQYMLGNRSYAQRIEQNTLKLVCSFGMLRKKYMS